MSASGYIIIIIISVSFSLDPSCARKYPSGNIIIIFIIVSFLLVPVAQGSIRLATLKPLTHKWELAMGKAMGAFLLPFHPNTYFVFLPTRLWVTSIFFLCWALLSQIVSSVENILSHNPLLGITWRCQPAKILHNRSTFFHIKSSRIMDLTLVKRAAMRTVWPRHRD